MGRGKAVAQGAHAACKNLLGIIMSMNEKWRSWLDEWLRSGEEKVVLKVNSESELLEIYRKAMSRGLPVSLVTDAGRTQLPPGTKTAVAIGPAPEEVVDEITGHLKLY
ncbi:MAG: peptidyl-tRNA hydrolase Pth2 [Desulfurococcales archaeon]|nr:peptidyl-tRNA hydrolase Pth2 [Desulfurococcales archaeon]